MVGEKFDEAHPDFGCLLMFGLVGVAMLLGIIIISGYIIWSLPSGFGELFGINWRN